MLLIFFLIFPKSCRIGEIEFSHMGKNSDAKPRYSGQIFYPTHDRFLYSSWLVGVNKLFAARLNLSHAKKCSQSGILELRICITCLMGAKPMSHPEYYTPSPKVFCLLVLKEVFKVFLPFMGLMAILAM